MKSENDNEESKWDSKINNWDKESREYYQEYKANYGDLQMKQRFRKVIRWRKYKVEYLDRRMETENTLLWHITQKSARKFVKFQKDF